MTFAAGETQQTVTVPVLGDTLDEANETFTVALSARSSATLGDAPASAPSPTTTLPALSITRRDRDRGQQRHAAATFTVVAVAAAAASR